MVAQPSSVKVGDAIAHQGVGVVVLVTAFANDLHDFQGGELRNGLPQAGGEPCDDRSGKGGAVAGHHGAVPAHNVGAPTAGYHVGLNATVVARTASREGCVHGVNVHGPHAEHVFGIAGATELVPSIHPFVAGGYAHQKSDYFLIYSCLILITFIQGKKITMRKGPKARPTITTNHLHIK